RRIVKLNVEAVAAFSDAELSGRGRLGGPGDYADRYLPEIMARVSRAYPGAGVTVICEPTIDLVERNDANSLAPPNIPPLERQPPPVGRAGGPPRRSAASGCCGCPRAGTRRTSRSVCRSRLGGPRATGAGSRSSGWRRLGAPTASSIRARTPARWRPRFSPVLP